MLPGWIWLSLAVIIVAIFRYRLRHFQSVLKTERKVLSDGSRFRPPTVITSESIQHYPPAVRLWLARSGVLNRPFKGQIDLLQQGKMRTSSKGKWMTVTAEQSFSTPVPGFVWTAVVKPFPLLHLTGKDSYMNGKGHMLINLLSVIPVINAKGAQIDQGCLVRYLAEIVWFPFAAVNDYIKWEDVDPLTARATITYGGISASALFRFNGEGDFISVEAKRYYSGKGRPTLENWLVETAPGAYREFDGIRVPDRLRVTWLLQSERFTWFLLKVTDIKYHEEFQNKSAKSAHHGYP